MSPGEKKIEQFENFYAWKRQNWEVRGDSFHSAAIWMEHGKGSR